ncbi:hypothetical protein PR202_gb12120 [Eleusine coracana subsp. coracana]|uniref:F-box protein AT5G49610-like beta-propeller domain-containing protein n=1 Tax=Eleusine coracana subsp. coracana TaxID=191504 RepID=A0AAV5EPM0_ELECO|nr:hypothetical protein PR202_gb12120 [Eleusine coracana subsp. coracana]
MSFYTAVSYRAFRRRYRRFHGAPPLLGFFHDFDDNIRFVPTMTAASPFRQLALDWASWAHDCRHGRLLLQHKDSSDFIVWDPITDAREVVPDPGLPSGIHEKLSCDSFCVVVVCSGGPFRVVFVGSDYCLGDTWAYIYSSETRAPTRVPHYEYVQSEQRAALVGDEAYFMLSTRNRILKLHLGEHHLSTFEPPSLDDEGLIRDYCALMGSEESGSLLLASIVKVSSSSLYMWSKKVRPVHHEGWVRCRRIQLESIIVPIDNSASRLPIVIGFVEGVGDVIITTKSGIFVLEVKSERVRKVFEGVSLGAFLPFTSFYTPGTVVLDLLPYNLFCLYINISDNLFLTGQEEI